MYGEQRAREAPPKKLQPKNHYWNSELLPQMLAEEKKNMEKKWEKRKNEWMYIESLNNQ